ncbi:hypothetical protein GSH19_04755 [Lactobacillus sp. S2-2]|uniref:hypothetical protein n=1 Tax=Lactobacillus sp. S2-2 TaxID=2692917 RepID=UPI001F24BEFB|nr:hypothetical protein [Lactobacillus sp. S2-2]MCF6515461.1 hypothetical protein [Lactobacillus sp. S2-2]
MKLQFFIQFVITMAIVYAIMYFSPFSFWSNVILAGLLGALSSRVTNLIMIMINKHKK